MAEDRLQRQRFELKYLINEDTALAVRDFVRGYLQNDEFGESQPDLSYPVHSLYLDGERLDLYHATINGDKNRFKLRLRFYDDDPDSPIFFEVKRRMNNCILKQRGGVKRGAVNWLLAGHLPDPGHLLSADPGKLMALQRFSALMNELHAVPKAHVAYRREAWVSTTDNSVRVTMDRAVQCEPEFQTRLTTRMSNPVLVFGNAIVLELKFTNYFPNWFRDLVQVFNLVQIGAAKYVDGISLLGEFRLTDRCARLQAAGIEYPFDGRLPQARSGEAEVHSAEREAR